MVGQAMGAKSEIRPTAPTVREARTQWCEPKGIGHVVAFGKAGGRHKAEPLLRPSEPRGRLLPLLRGADADCGLRY